MLHDMNFQASKADVSLKVLNAKRNIYVFESDMNTFLWLGHGNLTWK